MDDPHYSMNAGALIVAQYLTCIWLFDVSHGIPNARLLGRFFDQLKQSSENMYLFTQVDPQAENRANAAFFNKMNASGGSVQQLRTIVEVFHILSMFSANSTHCMVIFFNKVPVIYRISIHSAYS